MIKKLVQFVLSVVLILGVLSACSSKTSNDQPVTSTTSTSTDATTVKIVMNEFSFSQKEIKVKQGEKIHFIVTNSGKYAHDINSGELKIDVDAGPGKTTETDWTAPQKAGTYQIICDKPGHAAKGMTMTMTIE